MPDAQQPNPPQQPGRATLRRGLRDVLWLAAGAALFLVVALVVLRFRGTPDAAEQLAERARRTELVDQMRTALASASECEMGAVLAITDEDSQRYADQARAAIAAVDQGRQQLAGLLDPRGTPAEQQLLGQFTQAFDAVRTLDDQLLVLAVANTNIKAYALVYGPAADALGEARSALEALAVGPGGAPQDPGLAELALGAEVAALEAQTLLPPHVAEAEDARMDAMEARMAELEQDVGRRLDALQSVPAAAARPELRTAVSAWSRFRAVKAQILSLSRQNTNVRSTAMSLHERRDAVLACQAALDALRQAIAAEPIAGVTFGRPPKPR
jgi:hypothetical protein